MNDNDLLPLVIELTKDHIDFVQKFNTNVESQNTNNKITAENFRSCREAISLLNQRIENLSLLVLKLTTEEN